MYALQGSGSFVKGVPGLHNRIFFVGEESIFLFASRVLGHVTVRWRGGEGKVCAVHSSEAYSY